jgi:hypothetical protein
VIASLQGEYAYNPTKEFFGLGNNNVGRDPLSTNEYLLSALATIAFQPVPRLTAALTLGFQPRAHRHGRSRRLPRLFGDFRYGYGAGVRGDAILARIDVGFSNEETALVYLTFGHIF